LKKIFIVILCLFFLTGCWDRKELPQIGIVAAIAVDKDPENGEYIFTSQILKPAAESTQNPSPEKPFLMVSTTGKTIFDAIRKTNQIVDRKGFYAHNKVIILSEEIAKDGLLSILDSFQRGKEIRGYVWICIAKGTSARDILKIRSGGVSRVPANFLKSVIENTKYQLNSTSINMLKFYKETLGSGIDPVVGVLSIEERIDNSQEKIVKLSGGAVFKVDKLAGFLNESETRGYRWVSGDIESGAISLPSPIEASKFVSVEVNKMDAKIIPEVIGNHIGFTIDISEDGVVTEQQATSIFKDSKQLVEFLTTLEKENEKVIEEEVNKVIEKAKGFQTDIFGFGEALNKKYPETWIQVKDDWPSKFAEVPFSVNVKVNIKSSGLMKGPFKPVE